MRICYLLLVHHKFDQALRLMRRLAGEDSSFVLHIDNAADAADAGAFRAQLECFKPVLYAQRVRAQWGAYGQALAIMHCIQAAVRQLEPCDRYVLLSGQDYPIKDRAQITEFFAEQPEKEFIEAFPRDVSDAAASGWSPYYRFRRYHFWVGGRHWSVPALRKGPPPLPIFHGSCWWALTSPTVAYIAEHFDLNRQLRRYLRTGYLVDEVYIPTLIMASRFSARVVGENVTFAEWTPTSGPHPKTLRIGDLGQLLNSRKLFARKFDADVDESLLDELDALHNAK